MLSNDLLYIAVVKRLKDAGHIQDAFRCAIALGKDYLLSYINDYGVPGIQEGDILLKKTILLSVGLPFMHHFEWYIVRKATQRYLWLSPIGEDGIEGVGVKKTRPKLPAVPGKYGTKLDTGSRRRDIQYYQTCTRDDSVLNEYTWVQGVDLLRYHEFPVAN